MDKMESVDDSEKDNNVVVVVDSLPAAGRLRKSVIGENSGLKGCFFISVQSRFTMIWAGLGVNKKGDISLRLSSADHLFAAQEKPFGI